MQVKKFNFILRLKRGALICGVAILATFFFIHLKVYFFPPLPSQIEPLLLYSNQLSHSLKAVTIQAIEKSKRQLILHSFSLTDPSVIGLLLQKKTTLKLLEIKTDLKPIPQFYSMLEKELSWKRQPSLGLMHEKILLIDEDICFLGTANMTTESLTMHDNIMVGFKDEKLSKFFQDYALSNYPKNHKHLQSHLFDINRQNLKVWLLPCRGNKATQDLIEEIEKSKKSLLISMFTLTHPQILQAIASAKDRGVRVKIYLDKSSFEGASKKAALWLISQGVEVHTSIGLQLLHHKMALIDDTTLILGSANWTLSAFKKNRDFYFVLNPLTPLQSHQLKKIFQHISKHAKKAKFESITF